MSRRSEVDEWADELVRGWTEVYKKSMTTLILLRIVADHAPAPVTVIAEQWLDRTGWELTERGLYRTLRRLETNQVLRSTEVAVARTGVRRKDYELTELGREFLSGIDAVHGTVGRLPSAEESAVAARAAPRSDHR